MTNIHGRLKRLLLYLDQLWLRKFFTTTCAVSDTAAVVVGTQYPKPPHFYQYVDSSTGSYSNCGDNNACIGTSINNTTWDCGNTVSRTTPCGPDTALSGSCSSLVDRSYDFDFKCNYITADDSVGLSTPPHSKFLHTVNLVIILIQVLLFKIIVSHIILVV